MMTVKTDVCILGAGAGGIGCAYRLIKNGIKTVVVDKNPDFGGTMVYSGVDGWEPGVSLDGIHLMLKEELEKDKLASHIVQTVPNSNFFDPTIGQNWDTHSFEERPWGFGMPTGKTYEDTMRRCRFLRGDTPTIRFQFEPDCMRKAINDVFSPFAQNLTTLFSAYYKSCKTDHGKITSIVVSDGDVETEIRADFFVDASGDIILARDAGCDHTFGCESKAQYGEPSAPEKESGEVNGVTYVFRFEKAQNPNHIDEIPESVNMIDTSEWENTAMKKCVSVFTLYPNGDVNVNMLPTMQGREYYALGEKADIIAEARIYKYWNYLQREKNLQGYRLKHIFNAGVREGYRLKGKYILKEQDLRQGLLKQPKIGKTIAIADHSMDVHGSVGLSKELEYPYEIPLECAMTNEFENLFVACRGASFSHIASSSARLSRTMLSMGEGVGEHISKIIKAQIDDGF